MATDANKLAYWTQHRHAWQSSGLTQRTYCNREGLSFPAFAYWCKRVIRAHAVKDSTTLTLVRARPEVTRLPDGIELCSPSGWHIKLPGSVDYTALAQILAQLP